MKFCTDTDGPQTIHPSDFSNPLSPIPFSYSATMRLTFVFLREISLKNYWVDCHEILCPQ